MQVFKDMEHYDHVLPLNPGGRQKLLWDTDKTDVGCRDVTPEESTFARQLWLDEKSQGTIISWSKPESMAGEGDMMPRAMAR